MVCAVRSSQCCSCCAHTYTQHLYPQLVVLMKRSSVRWCAADPKLCSVHRRQRRRRSTSSASVVSACSRTSPISTQRLKSARSALPTLSCNICRSVRSRRSSAALPTRVSCMPVDRCLVRSCVGIVCLLHICHAYFVVVQAIDMLYVCLRCISSRLRVVFTVVFMQCWCIVCNDLSRLSVAPALCL